MPRLTRLRALLGMLMILVTAAVTAGPHLNQSEKVVASAVATDLLDQDRYVIEQLFDLTRDQQEIGQRMKTISARLLGRPYLRHPLIGSSTEKEQFVVRMDSFDCVTFLETVLALGGADRVEDFLERLRRIRYEDGVVSYNSRLHYMTDWNDSNVRRGILRDLTVGAGTVERPKTLSVVAGFKPRKVTLRYFQREQISSANSWLQDGDLIYFISARSGLDVFHVGLAFREGDRVLLRHASLKRGMVIDQRLVDFALANRSLGFIVARPMERRIDLRLHMPSE